MPGWLKAALVAIVIFGIYREWCQFQFWRARRRAQRERFRGLRLVVTNAKGER